MKVFIGNLPGQATLVELKQFLGQIDLRAGFNCCRGRDNSQQSYYFFIAVTQDSEEGWRLIQQLDGRCFLDKRIIARPFHERKSTNEPPPMPRERRCNRQDTGEPILLELKA